MIDTYHRLLQKIAHVQVTRPLLSVALLVAFTIMIYGGVSHVRTVASLEQMMPPHIEEIRAFHALRDQGLGQDIIAIVISIDDSSPIQTGVTDIRDRRVYDYLTSLTTVLRQQPDVLTVHSYADVMSSHDESLARESAYHSVLADPVIQTRMQRFIDSDAKTTMLLLTTDVSADDMRMNLLSRHVKSTVESLGHPPGTEIAYTGTPVIQQKLGELIGKDRTNTRWISTLFVFIITMIAFGTFTSALVPIAVVTLSVTWLYGTMGYTNLPISTLAGGVAAMVIGIGIDFAIHIMNKFKFERKKGNHVSLAIERAVVQTGSALTATSVTTIAAFLAFLTGVMPEMGRFGLLMAIGIFYSLLFSLFGLPALLVLEERVVNIILPKLRFGVEGEYHTEPEVKKHD